jgi:hypothetical protein
VLPEQTLRRKKLTKAMDEANLKQ